MNKNRQRRNKFYYEKLKHEKLSQEKFKNALKALHIDVNMLMRGRRRTIRQKGLIHEKI